MSASTYAVHDPLQYWYLATYLTPTQSKRYPNTVSNDEIVRLMQVELLFIVIFFVIFPSGIVQCISTIQC